ncbi:hypothetical protein ACFV30_31075 [Streptomyces sp. NPDC059752]|uniref:hypothetical protein n=1 Tax=unclassified Streptomyces TaxID=2593676 RepID=UPI0036635AAB
MCQGLAFVAAGRWRTGWVLLHTSKTVDRPALRVPLIGRTIRDRQLLTGSVVGLARITDCHQDPETEAPTSTVRPSSRATGVCSIRTSCRRARAL